MTPQRDIMTFVFQRYQVIIYLFRDTHRENTPSNKTKARTKTMSTRIWKIGTLNQLFIRGSYTDTKYPKN